MKKLLNRKKLQKLKKFYNKYKVIIIFGLIFLLIIAILYILLSGTLSKYVNKTNYGHGLTTSKMIFISDRLDNPSIDTVVGNYNFDPLEFALSNGIDGVAGKGDITYTGTCLVPEGYTCSFNDTTLSTFTATLVDNGTVVTNNHTVTVTPTTGTEKVVPLTLHVETTAPYTTSLDGVIYLEIAPEDTPPSAELLYSGSMTCQYSIVNTSGITKDVKVTINTSNYAFDGYSEMFLERKSDTSVGGSYNSITTTMEPYASKRLDIMKFNSLGICTAASITVS